MIILLTGVPGTGKNTVAKALQKQGFAWVPVNRIVKEKKLWTSIERGSKVVKMKALERELRKIIGDARKKKKNIIVEGHLVCEMSLDGDLCIVLRTNPKVLKKRLSRRRWPAWKVQGNLECELLDYCTQQAERNMKKLGLSGRIYEVNTTGKFKGVMRAVRAIIGGKGKRYKIGWVDWSHIAISLAETFKKVKR
jgi:broad-specificity NMP kinase